jgi:hypothetical protein
MNLISVYTAGALLRLAFSNLLSCQPMPFAFLELRLDADSLARSAEEEAGMLGLPEFLADMFHRKADGSQASWPYLESPAAPGYRCG